MKRLLCPTDFSDAGQNGVAYAAKLAQVVGAELRLFNVQSVFELTPKEAVYGKSLTIEAAKERLEEECRTISKAFKISCYGDVYPSSGSLARVIAKEGANYDMIVMGTDGASDIFEFFAGSHAYNVIRNANVPVMLIPEGIEYNDIGRTVYAFNYLEQRELPLKQLIHWIKLVGGDLYILQVLEEAYSQVADEDLRELQSYFAHLFEHDIHLDFDTIRSSEPAGSINSYVLRNNADMLALHTEHQGFLERLFHKSVIKTITGIAQYPVLIFHQ